MCHPNSFASQAAVSRRLALEQSESIRYADFAQILLTHQLSEHERFLTRYVSAFQRVCACLLISHRSACVCVGSGPSFVVDKTTWSLAFRSTRNASGW